MSVYDTIITFYSDKYPHEYLHIFSLNSGKSLASICNKGQGPEDFFRFNHRNQYIEENNQIKLWAYDNHKKSVLINLTKSIKNQITEIDSVLNIDWLKKHIIYWNEFLALDSKKFAIKSQAENGYIQGTGQKYTSYNIYQNTFDNKIATYELYKNIFDDEKKAYESSILFSSLDAIHPVDKDKIAMVMAVVPQINILNTNTGELTGYRLKGFNTKELLNTQFNLYYKHISVTKNHIYTLLVGLEIDKEGKNYSACTHEVHIFSWNGELVRRIFLEQEVRQIAINPINNKIYGINNEEEIFCFSIE